MVPHDPLVGTTRSELMSRIQARNTTPELIVRRALWARGLRYRVNLPVERVRVDIAFISTRLLLFVDGCFWHGCPEHYVHPKSKRDFWSLKLRQNVLRDRRQTAHLEDCGWNVMRVWEHEVFCDLDSLLDQVTRFVRESSAFPDRFQHWQVVQVESMPTGEGLEERLLLELRDRASPRREVRPRTTEKW